MSTSDELKKKIIIQVKEMGDVLQVFTMLAWYVCKSNNEEFKKNFVMTTIDSIVFLLCIMFQLPCIVYEFKNEEDDEENTKSSAKQKEEKGRTRYLQRYTPKVFTVQDKINQTIEEIEIFNKNIESLLLKIDSNTPIYISKTTVIKIKQEFLDYIKSIINFLTISANHLISKNSVNDYKEALNDLYEKGRNQNISITLPNFDEDFDKFITSMKNEIETLKTNKEGLLTFLQSLKINFMIYELFYEKQGKIYASTMITFLTQNRQSDTKYAECVLFFPCNRIQRKQQGKVSFAIWCQQNKIPSRGGSIMDTGLIKMPVYEKDIDNDPCIWTLQTVNMYSYLLSDIYGILREKLGSENISEYILYDIYTVLAFHFNLCNEVFYPENKLNDIAERIEMNSETSYLGIKTTEIYLDQIIEYILNEYNDPENEKGEPPLDNPNAPFVEDGMCETKCVNIVLKDLKGPDDEEDFEERRSEMSVNEVAEGVGSEIIESPRTPDNLNQDKPEHTLSPLYDKSDSTGSDSEPSETEKQYYEEIIKQLENDIKLQHGINNLKELLKEYTEDIKKYAKEDNKNPISFVIENADKTNKSIFQYINRRRLTENAYGSTDIESAWQTQSQQIFHPQGLLGGKNKSKRRAKSRKNKRTRRAKNKRAKKHTKRHVKKSKHIKSKKH